MQAQEFLFRYKHAKKAGSKSEDASSFFVVRMGVCANRATGRRGVINDFCIMAMVLCAMRKICGEIASSAFAVASLLIWELAAFGHYLCIGSDG